jgi:hypothetical protein
MRITPDPLNVNTIPWNTVVIDRTYTVAGSAITPVSLDQLVDDLLTQFGLSPALLQQNIELRFRSVKLWCLTPQQPVGVQPCDLATSNVEASTLNNRPRATITDQAGANHFSCVGYRWPDSDFAIVNDLRGVSPPAKAVFYTISDPTAKLEYQVEVLWRFIQPASMVFAAMQRRVFPPSIQPPSEVSSEYDDNQPQSTSF